MVWVRCPDCKGASYPGGTCNTCHGAGGKDEPGHRKPKPDPKPEE